MLEQLCCNRRLQLGAVNIIQDEQKDLCLTLHLQGLHHTRGCCCYAQKWP